LISLQTSNLPPSETRYALGDEIGRAFSIATITHLSKFDNGEIKESSLLGS
jgi:hypothetical protein